MCIDLHGGGSSTKKSEMSTLMMRAASYIFERDQGTIQGAMSSSRASTEAISALERWVDRPVRLGSGRQKKRPRRTWAVEARSGERGGWARRFSQDPSLSLRKLKKLEACESHLLSPATVQFLLVKELLTSAFRFLQSAFALVCCEHLVRIRCGLQSYNALLYWSKRVYQ